MLSTLTSEQLLSIQQSHRFLQPLINDIKSLNMGINPSSRKIDLCKNRLQECLLDAFWESFNMAPTSQEYDIIMNKPEHDGIMLLLILCPFQPPQNIHDHRTWAIIGNIKNEEISTEWRYPHSSSHQQPQDLIPAKTTRLGPGDALSIQPETRHSISSGSPQHETAICLHLYGQDLRTTKRRIYLPKTNQSLPHPNDEFICYESLFQAVSD